jgi:hypothetical protein
MSGARNGNVLSRLLEDAAASREFWVRRDEDALVKP